MSTGKRAEALTEMVCEFFNRKAKEKRIQRRAKPSTHSARMARLLKRDPGVSEVDLKVVILWALATWPTDELMRTRLGLDCILKSQGPNRTFFDYLEAADLWAEDTYGPGWRPITEGAAHA